MNVKKDATMPTCNIKASGTAGSNGWYRGNVTINLNYGDATSGVAGYGMGTSSSANYNSKSTMTQTGDTLGTSYYGYVKDKAGNTTKCNVSVKKDTTKPSCSVKASGTRGNNNWYKSNVNVSLSYSDSGSGINNYGLSTSSSTTYNKSKSVTHTADTKSVKYNGYVQDNAGNTNNCNTSFKKDATKPTCSISASTSSSTLDLTLKMTGKDSMSGLASSPYSWINQNSFGKNNTYTVKSNGTYNGYVKDNAGNIGSCSRNVSNVVRKPNKPTISNPSGGNWVNHSFSLTVSTTSPASILGYWYYSYDAKNWTRYDKSDYNSYGKQTFVTSPYSAERNQPTYIRVCNKQASGPNDTANCSDYASTMIRIDTTKPSLGYNLRLIYYGNDIGAAKNNKWARNQIKRQLLPKDNGSGINRVEYKQQGSDIWYTEGNVDYWLMNEGINDAKFRAYDNAGNVSNTIHLILKVDWTPPTFAQRIHKRDCHYTNNGYDTGSWFGYILTDNVSGVNYNENSKVEYCYTGHRDANCGATCSRGNDYSHKPSKIFGKKENYYFQTALFPIFTSADNAVSTSCVLGHSVRVNYKAVDNAGNVAKRKEVYDFPSDGNGNCYNFGL